MRFLDTLLGRTKAAPADLDRLFALPAAAVTLQAAADLTFARRAGVCFKPTGDPGFDHAVSEAVQLASLDRLHTEVVEDHYQYRWAVFAGGGLDELVTAVHGVNATLEERSYGNQLLCSAFAFDAPGDPLPLLVVYLYKRGSFYPFARRTKTDRDTEMELSVRSALSSDLPVEPELERWFPLWDSPID